MELSEWLRKTHIEELKKGRDILDKMIMDNIPAEVKAHLTKGGDIFTVRRVSYYRDGGTDVIETTGPTFYGHMKDHTIHSECPCEESNKITNQALLDYLKFETGRYFHREMDMLEICFARVEKLKFKL